jgi:hypothetical protein
MVAGHFAWPRLVLSITIVLLTAGLAVTLILAWYHGERGEQRATGIELLMLAALSCVRASISIPYGTRARQSTVMRPRGHYSNAPSGPIRTTLSRTRCWPTPIPAPFRPRQ